MSGELLDTAPENYETRLADRVEAIRSFVDTIVLDDSAEAVADAAEDARAKLHPELSAYRDFEARVDSGELNWENPDRSYPPPREAYAVQRSALRGCLRAIFRGLEVRNSTSVSVARHVIVTSPRYPKALVNEAMHDVAKINNRGRWVVAPEFPEV